MPQNPGAPNSTPYPNGNVPGSNNTTAVRIATAGATTISAPITEVTFIGLNSVTTLSPTLSQKIVLNRSTEDLVIYPPAGSQIEGYGPNQPVQIVPGGNATFIYNGAGSWRVI